MIARQGTAAPEVRRRPFHSAAARPAASVLVLCSLHTSPQVTTTPTRALIWGRAAKSSCLDFLVGPPVVPAVRPPRAVGVPPALDLEPLIPDGATVGGRTVQRRSINSYFRPWWNSLLKQP
jgi:hypothetical protein